MWPSTEAPRNRVQLRGNHGRNEPINAKVRTIVEQRNGTDRTHRKHAELQKIAIDRTEQVRWRVRKRTRAALPARVGSFVKESHGTSWAILPFMRSSGIVQKASSAST